MVETDFCNLALQLLRAVTVSLPLLAIRVAYALFSAFAPTGIPGADFGSSSLAAFNGTTGSFAAYLLMSVITEMAVSSIYVLIGLTTPLQQDYANSVGRWDETEAMKLGSRSSLYATGGGDPHVHPAQH